MRSSTYIECNDQLIKFSNTKLNTVHLVKTHNRMLHTTNSSTLRLNPYFITGFVDAEGCFRIQIVKRSNSKNSTGFTVEVIFLICLHYKDRVILESIQSHLKVGRFVKSGEKYVQYVVSSVKELDVVIKFFDEYPLITHPPPEIS